MRVCVRVLLLGAFLWLAGCAASVQRPESVYGAPSLQGRPAGSLTLLVKPNGAIAQSKDWNDFRNEWREAMTAAAAGAGIPFSFLDQESDVHLATGTLVVVTVNDYRYLSAGSRILFGVLTGNAYIDASAGYFELPQKRPLGERVYNTSSSAWQGIFSAMTSKQIAAICAEIVGEFGRAPRT